MDGSLPLTEGATQSHADAVVSTVEIPQYRRRAIVAVWAAAALPMAALESSGAAAHRRPAGDCSTGLSGQRCRSGATR